MIFNLKLLALSCSIAFITGGATAWKVKGWKEDSRTMKQVLHAHEAGVAHEVFKEKERIKYVTITKTVDRIVQTPFYLPSELCLDDAGMHELQQAINSGKPNSAVPAPGGAD